MTRQFVFSDEAGNFDFRDHLRYPGATRYFAVGTITIAGADEMRAMAADLTQLRFDLLHNGLRLGDYFHASEDAEAVRHAVFQALAKHEFRVDVTILEKSKAQPQVRASHPVFYKYAWFYHFRFMSNMRGLFQRGDELTLVSAALGNNKRARAAMRQSVEQVVTQCCRWDVPRTFGFWPTATDTCLQAADYALWAVMREFERGDSVWADYIRPKIKSSYDLFRVGTRHYYGPNASASA